MNNTSRRINATMSSIESRRTRVRCCSLLLPANSVAQTQETKATTARLSPFLSATMNGGAAATHRVSSQLAVVACQLHQKRDMPPSCLVRSCAKLLSRLQHWRDPGCLVSETGQFFRTKDPNATTIYGTVLRADLWFRAVKHLEVGGSASTRIMPAYRHQRVSANSIATGFRVSR